MKKLHIIGAVALAAALAFAATTRAAVCTVPGTHPTIQAAASDSTCNTIDVAAGTYSENVVVNFAGTTINGFQAGFRFDNRKPGGESVVSGTTPQGNVAVFTINAADVTIDGFTIMNEVILGSSTGIAVSGGGSDAAILNNIFTRISTLDPGGQGTAQAVYLTSGGADNVNIQDNEMNTIFSFRSAKGVLIGDNGGTNPSQMVQIKSNSIHRISSAMRGAYGVSVADVPNVSGLKITNNIIYDLFGGGWVHAIGLEGDTPGVMVTDNAISHIVDTGANNSSPGFIADDSKAIWFEANPSFGSAEVHNNNFDIALSSFGIAVDPTIVAAGSVKGSCNWWNSPTGPTHLTSPGGIGVGVSDRVTYAPFLTAPAPGGSCYAPATTAAQCKNGGWMTSIRADGSTFKNQGDCIQYVNTGK